MTEQELGRYRLSPGQQPVPGAVLRAEDTLLERSVELHLLPDAAAADPARLERVRLEVERAAEFVHPSAAGVYGLEEGGGRIFVTCEPRAGQTLDRALATAHLPPDRALEIALALCDVLASAKEEGIVHGALRPGDVVLGDDGSVTVGGFGLHELRRSLDPELGPAGGMAAPETRAGLLPDHRADVWALGRIAREMLAATDGEGGEGPAAQLGAILDRCLSDDPALRPGSAAELRSPLEEARRELLREPGPEPGEGEARAWRSFSSAGRWGLVAALVLLALLGVWAMWRGAGDEEVVAGRPAAEPGAPRVDLVDLAILPFAGGEADADAALARGFGLEVTRLLARDRLVSVVDAVSAARAVAVEPSLAPSGAMEIADREERASAARRRSAARLGVAHLLEGTFLWQRDEEMSRAEVTVRLTRAEDGEVLWQETLEAFFGEITGLQGRVAAGVRRRLGGGRGRQPTPPTSGLGAYEAYIGALGLAATATSPDPQRAAAEGFETAMILDPALLLAFTGRAGAGLALAATGAREEGLEIARRAVAAAARVDATHPEVGRVAGELHLVGDGDLGAARRALEPALERLPGDPGLLRSIAWIDRREGRWDEAIMGLTQASRRAPLDLDLVADLVQSLAWKRRFDEATREASRLASVLPGTAATGMLADLLLRQRGDTAGARDLLESMPEAARADPGWQRRMLRLEIYDGDFASALDRLSRLDLERTEAMVERAWIHHHSGDARRAADAFERARDLLDDRLEAEPVNPWLSSLLAQAYAGTGGAHLAARMGQRSVSQLPVTRDAVAGPELVERLARTYVLAGDHERALDELAFLLEIPSPVTPAVLRLDPTWRPLRQDPRFAELLERFSP